MKISNVTIIVVANSTYSNKTLKQFKTEWVPKPLTTSKCIARVVKQIVSCHQFIGSTATRYYTERAGKMS